MRYIGTLKGTFTIVQSVIADTEEQARDLLEKNMGDIIECVAEDIPEVDDIYEQ